MLFDPESFQNIVRRHENWRERWDAFAVDESLIPDPDVFENAVAELMRRLDDTYPFFHPHYAGQMLKPPHPVAVLGYLAGMLINSNNHALDGGPATGNLEKELLGELAGMVGYDPFLGHLTSSGTIANLEALWISRELHPGTAIAFSEQSHYTHARMCHVLGIRGIEVPVNVAGKMDVQLLRALCLSENIGTVVATIGTTGLGALDPLPEILALQNEFGFRVHVDAAYGGFYGLLACGDDPLTDDAIFSALSQSDSIVIDPHKHGMQPYGCGCVLFRDPSVGRFYKHDSPYTYFTSNELHLGEISLECSRAGASAAALWLTLRCFPLRGDAGLGLILRRCILAAREWASLLRTSTLLYLAMEPELDIVTFFCGTQSMRASSISECTDAIFTMAMCDREEPLYLSKLRVKTSLLNVRYPEIVADSEWTLILRSALMKPEHQGYVPELNRRAEEYARRVLSTANVPEHFDQGD